MPALSAIVCVGLCTLSDSEASMSPSAPAPWQHWNHSENIPAETPIFLAAIPGLLLRCCTRDDPQIVLSSSADFLWLRGHRRYWRVSEERMTDVQWSSKINPQQMACCTNCYIAYISWARISPMLACMSSMLECVCVCVCNCVFTLLIFLCGLFWF